MFINYHSVPKERDIQGAKLRFNSHIERGFAHNFTEKNNFYHCIRFVCHWIMKCQVAIKTLIVIHRTLREGDPTFREEILNYSRRGHILQISNFKDDSSPLGKLIDSAYEFVVTILNI